MWTSVRVLVAILTRRHPADDILQTYSDDQLNDLAVRFADLHVRGCERCKQEIRVNAELLDLAGAFEAPADEVSSVLDRISAAMAALSGEQQVAVEDVRRLLGRHAAHQLVQGHATPELRVELAAFLGNRAADSFLHRLTA